VRNDVRGIMYDVEKIKDKKARSFGIGIK